MVLHNGHGQARGGSHLRLTSEVVQTYLVRCAFLSGALLRSDQRRSVAIGWRSRISNKP